ncbi:hypothetical protein KVV02_006136 [Mortierella alpina]|uniref:Uncharacterized protein n=1 Tax=Mortierella alpina TaxID=64518 RepID=A0A9P8ABJ0_MORAP|nr:hypothetical protein KVV02_006136 [Mortierella alpina]
MLKPTPHAHRRTHSFENNTPPPYNQSQDGVYSGQGDNSPTGRRAGKELAPLQDFDDDLLAQVENIHDTDLLRRLLIQKEQERQGLASNLDLAARLGLDLHQQMQRLEVETTSKIQSLQDENVTLQSKAKHSQELSYQLSNAEYDVRELTGHNRFLQKELDTCRNELKIFRKELDELSEHMSEISAEMMDAKSKVNSYARRLGEVEQELAATQELNVNLQIQLDNALKKQKQTQSSTTQAVKLIQSDLGKVFSDSDTMRLTLEELEARQMKCEGKVVEMMTNTREYAQLLEEAQETIHTLRIESDLEGRGWSAARGPQAAIWDNKTGEHPELEEQRRLDEANQRSRRSSSHSRSEDTESFGRHQVNSEPMEELDPMFDSGPWSAHPVGTSTLGQELGNLDQELNGFSRGLDQELAGFNHGSLVSELGDSSKDKRDHSPSMFDSGHHRVTHEDAPVHIATSLPQRLSLSAELHQRLEENNILQTVLSGTSRPPWTTSGGAVGISSVLSPLQQSPSSIRDIGRTLSMMTMANQKAGSTLGVPGKGSQPGTSSFNPTQIDTGKSSLASSGSNHDKDVGNTSFSSVASSSDGRRATLDTQNTLGLKYLLLATSSADLSNVITKTKASSIPIPSSQHQKARPSSSAFAVNAQANLSSSVGKSAAAAGSRGREGRTRTSSFSTSDVPTSGDSVFTPDAEATSTKPIPIASNRSNRNSMTAAASWSTSAASSWTYSGSSRRPSLPPVHPQTDFRGRWRPLGSGPRESQEEDLF